MTSTLTIRNSPTEFFVENKNFFSTNTNTMPIGKVCAGPKSAPRR